MSTKEIAVVVVETVESTNNIYDAVEQVVEILEKYYHED